MPTDHRAALADVKTFPKLIAYLRDEMDWPISQDSFEEIDDLFYDFLPDELGIDPRTAAKIEEIRRLRPLSPQQPWGIFFVKFQPRQLPVVALRRILGSVVKKKRPGSGMSERTVWDTDDLLFISNFGETGERRISFAHFSAPPDNRDLPTLKVLGWDSQDTPLHLDAVAEDLTRKLAWPNNPNDTKRWREQWSSAFRLEHRQVINTSKQLSVKLAHLARRIRDRISSAIAIETEKGKLTQLMKAFQTALVHDLDADGFADMYAQTIAYGLLSARIADPNRKTADDFAAHMRTSPFLRELMETFLKAGGRRGKAGGPGIDFDELGVSEVVELLDDANMEAVVRDFGDRNPQEDPVIHFYELFLKEYDAKKRMQRGVFYTPRPMVSYIVRSVDELLRTEFGLADGLADTTAWGEMVKRNTDLKIPAGISPDQDFVQILDPATGTGTFLVEVIDLIHKTLVTKWKAQGHGEKKIDTLWNEYVPKHLLTRLHGYELLMAPYAIAHLKIGLKLYETGYRFGSDVRARVYLTNALEPAQDFSDRLAFAIPALANESQAVNSVKQRQRFSVVVGNPPYAGHSANKGTWIGDRIRDYYFADNKPLGERNSKWLQDDYVKFVRLGEWCVQETACGVTAFVTNHGYLDNPTFRGMRQSLLTTFGKIFAVNLQGNVKKGGGGAADENVFDIQQGVAIGIWVRSCSEPISRSCFYGEIKGSRSAKYERLLLETAPRTASASVAPASPHYLLLPQAEDLRAEFASAVSLTSIFGVFSMGITTGRDQLCISFNEEEARAKLRDFVSQATEAELVSNYGLSNKSGWNIAVARKSVRTTGVSKKNMHAIAYRPFDVRILYLDAAIVGRPRLDVMKNMLQAENIALCTTRQVNGDYSHVLCTRLLANDCLVSLASGERTYSFPLFIEPDQDTLLNGMKRESNLVDQFLNDALQGLGFLKEKEPSASAIQAEDMFSYIYSLLHSRSYRSRYAEFLKIEFPRVPLTQSVKLFRALARLGGELVVNHLLESPSRDEASIEFFGGWNPSVEKVSWSNNTIWLDKAQTTGFKHVREDVWTFHIGGYKVCEKWLKDRKGRTLSKDDITHYQKIVVSLRETIRLMKEIDEVIELHGGWPGAFAAARCQDTAI